MEKYSRVISVSGRSFRATQTMCDIFVAHASDIRGRRATELVPLLHEGGVDMLLIGPMSAISVVEAEQVARPDITGQITGLPIITAA